MIRNNKKAKIYLVTLMTLNILGFAVSLITNEQVAILGCYLILASMALTVGVILDSMNSTEDSDGEAKFKVYLISLLFIVIYFISMDFLK